MAMPKKGRREINVDGTIYHYKISGSTEIIIQNTDTGKFIKYFQDNKPKWGVKCSPGFIRHLVETDGKPTEAMDSFYYKSLESKDHGHEFTLKFNESNNYDAVDFKNKTAGDKSSIARNTLWIINCAESKIDKAYEHGSPRKAEMSRLCANLKGQLLDQLTEEEAKEIKLIK